MKSRRRLQMVDRTQLLPRRAPQSLQQTLRQVVVDGGHISTDDIVAMADRGIDLPGPTGCTA